MNREILNKLIADQIHLQASKEMLDNFISYESLLIEWNKKFNLTAIIDEEGILEKHFIDSIFPAKFVDFNNKSLADIGTGAGFPGIPLAILIPSLQVTLIEANGKKISFLNEVKNNLKLNNVHIVQGRAEEMIKYRESFDLVTARAMSQLNVLLELSIPLLKVGGSFLAYKLYDVEPEIVSSERALKILDCTISSNQKYELPLHGDKRSLLVIKKLKQTKKRYPRLFTEISKSPL